MAVMQVVNSDDLEHILGPRPFKSAELRNIDKFRDGFKKGNDAIGDIEVENPRQPPTPTPDGKMPGTLDGPGTPHTRGSPSAGVVPEVSDISGDSPLKAS